MPQFKDWNSLQEHLTKKISSALQNEVFEEIRDCEQKHINEDVYGIYAPKIYKRRDGNGGLIADQNIQKNIINDLTIEITNETPANPAYNGTTDKDLAELIEYGHGYKGYQYDYVKEGAAYLDARPFTQRTIEELQHTKAHIKALEKGLL